MAAQVFLGGTADPATWRSDTVIPALEESGISYYNPQVDEQWSPELVQVEAAVKAAAEVLLFAITGDSRGVASMVEATEYICAGRTVVLVVQDIRDGLVLDGQVITGRELLDLNRARAYLRDVATRHHVAIHGDIAAAIRAILDHFSGPR